jgi:hypothetical protein
MTQRHPIAFRSLSEIDFPAFTEWLNRPHLRRFFQKVPMIGKGLGRAMLSRYLREIAFPLFPDEQRCFIGHEHENVAGWRNSESVGFRFVRDFVEGGAPSRLLVLERGEMAESRG